MPSYDIVSRLDLAEVDNALQGLAREIATRFDFKGAKSSVAREEMALTVEDVLARRTRALFLNAGAAITMAESVAKLLAGELGRDESWAAAQVRQFHALAEQYRVV